MQIEYKDTTESGYTSNEVALSAKILSAIKSSHLLDSTQDLCLGAPLTPRLKHDLEAAGVKYDEKVAKVGGKWGRYSAFLAQSEDRISLLESTWVTASTLANHHKYKELEPPNAIWSEGEVEDNSSLSAEDLTLTALRACAAKSLAVIEERKTLDMQLSRAVREGFRSLPIPANATPELRDWIRKSRYLLNQAETEIWW